jgi:chromosome segregation ATPase
MTDDTSSRVLEHLRALRSELRDLRHDTQSGIEALKARMSSLEAAFLTVKREIVHGDETDAHLQAVIDRLAQRIERIERRLELS